MVEFAIGVLVGFVLCLIVVAILGDSDNDDDII